MGCEYDGTQYCPLDGCDGKCNQVVGDQQKSSSPLDDMVRTQEILSVVRSLKMLPVILDEAAGNLRDLMDTEEAEKLKVRHYLPDELEGSAYMLQELFERIGAELNRCLLA